MDKETSSRVSSIASRLIHTTGDTIVETYQRGFAACCALAKEIQTLAGSALSQDETPGNDPSARGDETVYQRPTGPFTNTESPPKDKETSVFPPTTKNASIIEKGE